MTNSYIGNSYYPQPGTIAARAMAVIEALAVGEEIANAVLSEQLEQPTSVVVASLRPCVDFGLLDRIPHGRNISWRRGNGQRRNLPPADDEEPLVHRVVPAKGGDVALRTPGANLPPPDPHDLSWALAKPSPNGHVALPDVPRWPGLDAPSEPVQVAKMAHALLDELVSPEGGAAVPVMPPPAPVISPAAPRKGMRIALWSDGTLQIQRSVGDVIVLTVDETRQLVRYLERMGESADA